MHYRRSAATRPVQYEPGFLVIFITALDDAATRGQALSAGCIAYLQKPVHARQLMDANHKATP
jgi:DNA-binding response OmpR family regulator